jgi:hypothetical protein
MNDNDPTRPIEGPIGSANLETLAQESLEEPSHGYSDPYALHRLAGRIREIASSPTYKPTKPTFAERFRYELRYFKDSIKDVIKGLAGIFFTLVALGLGIPLLMWLRLEWVSVALASSAITRVWAYNYERKSIEWANPYFLAAGIALVLYVLTAGPNKSLFGLIFHPDHFQRGVRVGSAALLSIWAGIAASHLSYDPEWAREKRRRKSESH